MPCLGCKEKEEEIDKTRKSSRYSLYGIPDQKIQQKRADNIKMQLQMMEELSEATYGLAVEGKENKRYEAQDFFIFKEIMGSGVMAVVFRAYFKPTGKPFAVKFIPHFKQSRTFVARELAILKLSASCRYIVHYHSHFRVGPNMYFVMELCEGGSFEELLGLKSLMPPRLGRTYLKELSIALMFLHSMKVVHRDVHLANCLITSTAHLRLTDFGLSRTVDDPSGQMMTICGRAAIRAPELYLDKPCGFGLDWWSVGVMLYRFLTGYYPFHTEKLTQGYQYVTKLKEKYPEWLFDDPYSTDFCQKLLEKDPKQRIGYVNESEEIKTHPYFSGLNWDGEENIESVLEQDIKVVSKQYLPVSKKILQILGVQNHPLLGVGESGRESDISLASAMTRGLQSRSIARTITQFLQLSSQQPEKFTSPMSLTVTETSV